MSTKRKNRRNRRKKERKSYNGERFNKHHIIPRSRGGCDSKNNLACVNQIEHDKYHWLFSNKTPSEILEYLIDIFWNGEDKWLKTTLKRRFEMTYKPISEVMELPDKSFWRMNKEEFSTCDIEWTGKCGGWIRVRLCDLYSWTYKHCPDSTFAESDGFSLVDKLQRKFTMEDNLKNKPQDCSFYQGA